MDFLSGLVILSIIVVMITAPCPKFIKRLEDRFVNYLITNEKKCRK